MNKVNTVGRLETNVLTLLKWEVTIFASSCTIQGHCINVIYVKNATHAMLIQVVHEFFFCLLAHWSYGVFVKNKRILSVITKLVWSCEVPKCNDVAKK